MRQAILALAILTCACGPAKAPADATTQTTQTTQTASGDTSASGPDGDVQGPFTAVSTTAMSITGDASFSVDTVSFMDGILVHTRSVDTLAAFDPMAANGDTFDGVAPGADDRVVDLRAVTSEEVSDDERANPGGLCGSTTPTFVALVHEQNIQTLAVVAFSGPDQPGRGAKNSQVCATYSYAAPD